MKHKRRTYCDTCNKEINRWYRVSVSVEASNSNINVANIIKRRVNLDVCSDCYDEITKTIRDIILRSFENPAGES